MSLLTHLIPALNRTPADLDQPTGTVIERTIKPAYEIQQSPEAFTVVAYLPGVTKEGLELTAENGQISIRGRRAWKQPEGWTPLYRESSEAAYQLVLTHENAVDADRIVAELNDGVLRVTLPKSDAIKPRKIAVN